MEKGQEINGLVFSGAYTNAGRGIFRCTHCGGDCEIVVRDVLLGKRLSCGCLHGKNPFGYAPYDYERLFGVWRNMQSRCYDARSERYYTYGAKGVTVCDEWRDNFRVFAKWAHENGWRRGLSIERENLNGPYCPENCTFITMAEQARNKRSNIRIVIDGVDRCLTEWCEIYGVDFKVAWARYQAYGHKDIETIFYPGDLRERRTFIQLSLDGQELARYNRLFEATKATGANPESIRRVCRGKGQTAGGFRWTCEAAI